MASKKWTRINFRPIKLQIMVVALEPTIHNHKNGVTECQSHGSSTLRDGHRGNATAFSKKIVYSKPSNYGRSCTLRDGHRGNANAHAPSGMDAEAMQTHMHPQGWKQYNCPWPLICISMLVNHSCSISASLLSFFR